jgi:5-methylcytosine-specific restriction endonuclease McrA
MDKKNIPKIKKQEIWYHYIGEDIGRTKCFCCNINDIRQLEFHCGHIIPKSKGGEMSLQNLRPICSKCNLSMGNENMIDFYEKIKLLY